MVDTVGIGVIQDSDLACSYRSITCASRFLLFVEFFHHIRPDLVEDRSFIGDWDRVAKNSLRIILVKLHEFRFLPNIPIVIFKEPSPC